MNYQFPNFSYDLGNILRSVQQCTNCTLKSHSRQLMIHQKNGKILLQPVRYKSIKPGKLFVQI